MTVLDDAHLIRCSTQIVSQTRSGWCTQRRVQSRAPQVRINHKNATIRLTDQGLAQISHNKCLAFARHRACHQNGSKCTVAAKLVETRAQRAKLLRSWCTQGWIEENAYVWVDIPMRM